VEAIESATFCHACGARLDESTEHSPADAASQGARKPRTDEQDADDDSPRGRFRSAGRRSHDDDQELELWEGGYSPKAMIGSWIGAGFVSILLLAVAIYYNNGSLWFGALGGMALLWTALALTLAYRKMSVHYRLTNQRFFHQKGILRRQTDRIEVIDMDDITWQQGLIERMLGVGTIRITSSDRTDPELVIRGIDDVQRVAAAIDKARRDERVRRGLHIESV
jgi:membrane protein YdbS with pleckstrin-like domain